jgi:hypothetical protein
MIDLGKDWLPMRVPFNLVKPDLAIRCFDMECVVVHQSAADESSVHGRHPRPPFPRQQSL